MYADDLARPWFEALADHLGGAPLFDAHTHTGQDDPDGFRCTAAELTAALEMIDTRGVVFTMHEPDGYPAANDRVLAEAAASEGRLVPFCRLDPAAGPVEEAERCLARGARGLKLHPRAEGFTLDEPAVAEVFALAHERRLPVMIHAGRGIPALGRHVLELAEQFPGARPILAHAGISDLSWIWRRLDAAPNLFFDTSWWNPADLLALLCLVPPGRILYASDAPYGTPLVGAVLALRCAVQAGVAGDALRAIAGEQVRRLVEGEEPLGAGVAPGGLEREHDLLLERVSTHLVSAVARMLAEARAEESIALARLACDVGEGAPQEPVCRSVLALLDRHEQYAERAAAAGERVTAHLVLLAATVARTPRAALPEGV